MASVSFTTYAAFVGNTVFVITNSLLALSACVGLGVWMLHRQRGSDGGSHPPRGAVHHIGIACHDLERSIAFYSESLRGSVEMRLEEAGSPVAMLSLPGGCRLELFQSPCRTVSNEAPPGSSEGNDARPGSLVHFAVAAHDVEQLTADLVSPGGRISSPPAWIRLDPPDPDTNPDPDTARSAAPVAHCSFVRGPSGELVEVIRIDE